jgi:hypothetical protein
LSIAQNNKKNPRNAKKNLEKNKINEVIIINYFPSLFSKPEGIKKQQREKTYYRKY